MADQNVSYKLNLNRNKTKKWQQAQQINYGGDGWGDDDDDDDDYTEDAPSHVAPGSDPSTMRQQAWGPQPAYQPQRPLANAPSSGTGNRLSFEQNDDRRQLNTGRVPTNVPRPLQMPPQSYRQHPLLQPDTHLQQPGSRNNRMSEYAPIPVIDPPDALPTLPRNTTQSGSPIELPATSIGSSYEHYPTVSGHDPGTQELESEPVLPPTQRTTVTSPTKTLPFVRPSDIYKRVEEEREKERQSQESTRPSLDATTGQLKDDDDRTIPKDTSKSTNMTTSSAASGYVIKSPAETGFRRNPEAEAISELPSRQASSAYSTRHDPISATSDRSIQHEIPLVVETSSQNSSSVKGNDQGLGHHQNEQSDLPQFDRGLVHNYAPTADSTQTKPDELSHQPSLGYKSVVQKAFDDESYGLLSPSTTNETLPRSNSASTAEISPIIERRSDFHAESPRSAGVQDQTILEEEGLSKHRPDSTATIKADSTHLALETSEPPVISPGFRRDTTPPSSGLSAAKGPLSVASQDMPRGESASISQSSEELTVEDTSHLGSVSMMPSIILPQEPSAEVGSTASEAASSISRTASQDYQRWKEQRLSFHARHGTDHDSTTSAVSSPPVSRSATPSHAVSSEEAGFKQPETELDAAVSLPSTKASIPVRLKEEERTTSFRPSLPGGWQSDLTVSSNQETSHVGLQAVQPPFVSNDSRSLSKESIPTAKPPRIVDANHHASVDKAFAAAAAAGTALAGSFSSSAFADNTHEQADDDSSEDSHQETAFASHDNNPTTRDVTTESMPISTVTGSDLQTPSSVLPQEVDTKTHPKEIQTRSGTSIETSPNSHHTPVEFPAPLRMSKLNEGGPMSARPSLLDPTSVASNEDPEQLQHDIVQSLTPQTSNVEHAVERIEIDETPHPFVKREDSYDSVLPEEYSSYWQNESTTTKTVHDKVTEDRSGGITEPVETAPAMPISTEPDEVKTTTIVERPSLDQRYSWENSFSVPPLVTGQSKTAIADPTQPILETPDDALKEISNVPQLPHVDDNDLTHQQQPAVNTGVETLPDNNEAGYSPNVPAPLVATGPASLRHPMEKVDFQSILAYTDLHQRVAAFEENRRLYTEPNSLLDHWLASLNIPEHAEVFITSRQQRVQHPNAQAVQTPPRRDISLPSSTRQMQEDGKRILAVAGKYGGKAGSAAKGLFAKGKDKFRTASAGDKGSFNLTRKSTATTIDTTSPTSPESQRSAANSNAPQLPTPTLSTPVEEVSWSLISSTIDQIFNDVSPHPKSELEYGRQLAQLGIRGEVTRRNEDGFVAQSTTTAKDIDNEHPGIPSLPNTPKAQSATPKTAQISAGVTPQGKPAHATPADQSTPKALPALPAVQSGTTNVQKDGIVASHRRNSLESAVSDLSQTQNPPTVATRFAQKFGPSEEMANMTRSNTKTQEVPLVLSNSLLKQNKLRQGATDEGAGRHASLPPFNSPVLEKTGQRAASGTSVVPLGELKGLNNGERRALGRPFSFIGTDTMSSVPSYRPGGSPPPITPTEGQTSKVAADQKTLEPDITEHPAYQQEDESADAHNPQTATNPLPSSRRPPEELENARRQNKPPGIITEPEGYRIPGPYVQEYRSPRPKHSSEQILSSGQTENTSSSVSQHPNTTAIEQPMRPRPPSEDHQLGLSMTQGSNMSHPMTQGNFLMHNITGNSSFEPHTRVEIPRPQTIDKSRNLPFGNLFRTRGDLRNNEDRRGHAFGSEHLTEDKKKRTPFFRMGNRSASPVKQLGGLPEDRQSTGARQSAHRRLLSSDLLRTKPYGLKSSDGRRKRSSGLGALFLRGNNKDKVRSDTSLSHRSEYESESQHQMMQPYMQYANPTPPGAMHTNFDARYDQHQQYHGAGLANSGYLGSMGTTTHEAHGYYDPTHQPVYDDYNGSVTSSIEHRPDHLRLDTTGQQGIGHAFSSSNATPYTATSHMAVNSGSTVPTSFSASPPVPVTRARRDISYGQDRPYIPPTSSPKHIHMAEHVMSLNKRSRSPRLGKPSSDEFLHKQYGIVPGAEIAPDPAESLGTFYSKKSSPVGAVRSEEEQEKPWTLTLPTGHDETASDKVNQRISSDALASRGRQRSLPGQPSLTDSQNISDILKKSIELTQAPSIAPQPEPAVTHQPQNISIAEAEKSQLHTQEGANSLLSRTPSPFLNSSDMPRASRQISASDRLAEKQLPSRSTTPVSSPPVSFRNFLNTTTDAARAAAGPRTSTIRSDTITTTTTTSKGLHGLVTKLSTSITPGEVTETFTPVERPPSTAPTRNSQTKSASLPKDIPNANQVTGQQTKTAQTFGDPAHPVNGSAKQQVSTTTADRPALMDITQTAGSGNSSGKSAPANSPAQARPVSPLQEPSKPFSKAKEPHPSKIFAPVELPGSKPDGYESEDEPVMSATFFPGQEWTPAFERWDD